ncbi:MAG: hypothetical protein JXR03_14695 [Cyclobacteriaceae bacterium]
MRTIQIYWAICLWIGYSTASISQAKESTLPESQISASVVVNHYLNAPKTVPVKWAQFEENDQSYFKAFCEEGQKKIVFLYNEKGALVEKWKVIEQVPQTIKKYLDFEFAKYKTLSYYRVENKVSSEVYFSVHIDSKYRGYRNVQFDVSGKALEDGISEFVVSN